MKSALTFFYDYAFADVCVACEDQALATMVRVVSKILGTKSFPVVVVVVVVVVAVCWRCAESV